MDGFLNFLVVELRGIPPGIDVKDASNPFKLTKSELVEQIRSTQNPHKLHAPDPPRDDPLDSDLTIPQNFLSHMSLVPYLYERLMYFLVVLCIDATLFDITIAPLQALHFLIKLISPKRFKSIYETPSNSLETLPFSDKNNDSHEGNDLIVDQFGSVSPNSLKENDLFDSNQSASSPSFSSPKSIVGKKNLQYDNDVFSEIEISDLEMSDVLSKAQFDNNIESFGGKNIQDDQFPSSPFKSFVGDEFSEYNLTSLSYNPFTGIKDKVSSSSLDNLKNGFKSSISFENLKSNFSNKSIEHGISKLYGLSEFFNSQPSIPEWIGATRFFVIIISFLIFSKIDTSRVYHYIRGQPFIKLYVIFNMLEIFERLCRTLGRDLFDLLSKSLLQCLDISGNKKCDNFTDLFNSCDSTTDNFIIKGYAASTTNSYGNIISTNTYKWIRFGMIFFLVTVHSLVHTFMHLIRVMSLNIAINSSEAVMFLLLVTNNFTELKSSVFKKYSNVSLFMIAASDSVERFHFFSDAFLVFLKMSTSYRKFKNSYFSVSTWLISVLLVEIVVDWCKFCFMLKFNRINSQTIYRYHEALVADTLLSRVTACANELISFNFFVPCKSVFNYSHIPSRRLNFSSIPFVILVLCSLPKVSFNIWGIVIVAEIWLTIILVKILTSILLVAFVIKKKESLKQLYQPFDKVDST